MKAVPTFETIRFKIEHQVAQITLNRPDSANAVNGQMALDLFQAILHCDENPAVRAVLLTSTGNIFCAGGDLKEFAKLGEDLPAHVKEITVYLHATISRMARMAVPVIAAVSGIAGGAGLSLVCACDLVVAADTARFTMAYTRAGLTPDGSSTYFLPRRVGLGRAIELTLTNRILSAQEALDWGLISRVLPADDLMKETTELAVQLAAGPTLAYGAAKRLLHLSMTESLETQMEHEAQAIANITRTADTQEGITAFLEKRPPEYRGK
jgi:2-(1,2-epoxy-1,2-dihydrophenyl)acetyl-CoA isomerase